MEAMIQQSDRPLACALIAAALVLWQGAHWVSYRRRLRRDDRNVVKFPH